MVDFNIFGLEEMMPMRQELDLVASKVSFYQLAVV